MVSLAIRALDGGTPSGQWTRGAMVHGGLEIDVKWYNGQATTVVLHAQQNGYHRLHLPQGQQPVVITDQNGQNVAWSNEHDYIIPVVQNGKSYTLSFD
jgi:alpha-L-fucosidase 2